MPSRLKLDIMKKDQINFVPGMETGFIKKHPVYWNSRGETMGEYPKECQECGWRGPAAELDETNDDSSGQTQIFCPDCGGSDIQDLNPAES